MSSPQDNTVVVKLRFVSDDADARRGMRALADEARRAAAEQDRYNRRRGGPPAPGQIGHESARLKRQEDERIDSTRRGAAGGPSPIRARLRGRDLYEQRAGELLERRQEQAGFERFMAGRGLTPGGDALPVERGLVGRGMEAIGGRLGLPAGVAGRVGPYAALAAPAVAGKTALDEFTRARQIDTTPFLGPLVAQEQKLRGLPLGAGRAYGYAADTTAALNGDLDARRASAEYRVMESNRTQLTGRGQLRLDEYQGEVGRLRNRAEAFADVSLDRRSTQDQSTVRGQQQYDLESKLLPARRELTVASRERAAAERSLADAVKLQETREKKLESARERYDAAERKRSRAAGRPTDVTDHREAMGAAARQIGGDFLGGGGVFGLVAGGIGLASDLADRHTQYQARESETEVAKKGLDAAQAAADQARGATDARRREVGEARHTERQAGVEVTRAELADARERAGESAAGARQLGGWGEGVFRRRKSH